VVLGDFLYVIGGYGALGRTGNVERAPVNTDGTLGTFITVSGIGLNTPRNLFTAFVSDGYLYVIGGLSDTGELTSIERASIDSDGSLGAFATISSGALLIPRISPANPVVGNALYVVGGRNSSAAITTMEHATINTDGSLGAFNPVQGIGPTMPRASHTVTSISDFVYLVGGDVNILDSVERASLR
jgi:hypothetical protein